MICHILADVKTTPERAERLHRMVLVLTRLGYDCHRYGDNFVDETEASNLESQNGVFNGTHASFANKVRKHLNKSSKQDLIIATEAWHSACFKNLMDAHGGRFHDMPVIELWIDYPHSFAPYRIFASRYAMYHTHGFARIGIDAFGASEPWPDWIHARPFFSAKRSPKADVTIREFTMRSPTYALDHLEALANGVPVVAPDWGVWAEYFNNSITGMLYRSNEGFTTGKQLALQLASGPIIDWVNESFSIETACRHLERFLARLSNA